MPRGGARQGTPGKGYSNRTDLMSSTKPPATGEVNPAAAGGMSAPPPQGAPQPAPQMPSPDDSPMLGDPTQYPQEPITSGLPIGAGPGPQQDRRLEETRNLQRYLPIISPYLDRPETPDSVRMLFRYIRGA